VRARRREWRNRLIWLLLAVSIIAADQFTKLIVRGVIDEGDRIAVIDRFFYFTQVQNQGAAFGIFSDMPDGWRELLLTSLGGVALVLVVTYSIKLRSNDVLAQLALHLIFAGAIGNLTDRFAHGSVTDFLLFRFGGWSFPSFNIADSAIVIGVGLLLIDTFRFRKKGKVAEVEADPAADAPAAGADIELSGERMPPHTGQQTADAGDRPDRPDESSATPPGGQRGEGSDEPV
jgi:signal peptidase II